MAYGLWILMVIVLDWFRCQSGDNSSLGESIPKAFKLEFENTNNTVEYKALILGLEEAKRK